MNTPAAIVSAHDDKPWRARFTTAEFLRMAELGAFYDMKVELVHGEIERMNPPMSMHALVQTDVVVKLTQAVRAPLGVLGEVGLDLGDDTVRGCDAAIVRNIPAENRMFRTDEIVLLVEVAETTLDRDLGDKLADYAAAGVPHYWVIDREAATTHVHAEPVGSAYRTVDAVRFGEPLAVPGTDRTIVID